CGVALHRTRDSMYNKYTSSLPSSHALHTHHLEPPGAFVVDGKMAAKIVGWVVLGAKRQGSPNNACLCALPCLPGPALYASRRLG
ncbi:MAG: hypothetical protein QMD09_14860, partial [Desulfatibacillaceae bacterium]|nr:hypothetical protein [Desulfatibacillaceae bacterium]